MKLIVIFTMLLSTNIFGSCDWSTVKETDKGYLYSKECHIEVGNSISELEGRREQVETLKNSLKLKDLALNTSNMRIEDWKTATYQLEDRLLKHDRWSGIKSWSYFGTGVGVTILSVWAASLLAR